ncbi:CBS domain-containing protein [Anaeromyxobacter oryzae]|uniref:CBS domain-containing protein n=1 Tax=Anaeromyxobacter oryzae TaxID=2918170 RepID=A0ABN6MPF1_9BACT|nr:CBS domain-containing protein [Anaeromyxobacter oryzae]BDG02901.1 hypothetical protein AMOR_18970 [Anaeromyxobacter oryzae]
MIRTLLDIRNIHVLSGDGQAAELQRVHCPAHDRTVALEQCLACAESGGVTHDAVTHLEYASCRQVGAGAEARREEARKAAERAPVSAVMTRDVFAVRPDLGLEAVTELLLERGFGGAPVVDGEGRPIGVVSRTDVLDHRFDAGDTGEAMAAGARVSRGHYRVELGRGVHAEPPPDGSVADVMTRSPLTVPESAPVAEAATLMAERGIHRALVVANDGRLSGIITTSDIVRWVAERGRQRHPRA